MVESRPPNGPYRTGVGGRGPLIHGRAGLNPPRRESAYRPFVPNTTPQEAPSGWSVERRERLRLAGYLGATLLISMLTNPVVLAIALACVLIAAGRAAPRILRRALLATLAFSALVSIAYAAQVYWLHGVPPWRWLATINLRVLAMASLTFLYIDQANPFAALSFSKRLSFVLILAVSQSLGLRKTLEDFRLAMHSRGLPRAGLRARYQATARAAAWLFDRALANAHDSAQALAARGLFK